MSLFSINEEEKLVCHIDVYAMEVYMYKKLILLKNC